MKAILAGVNRNKWQIRDFKAGSVMSAYRFSPRQTALQGGIVRKKMSYINQRF